MRKINEELGIAEGGVTSPGSASTDTTRAGHGDRSTNGSKLPVAIIATCGAAIAFDGYDLVVYGATLHDIRDHWGLTPSQAGVLGSVPLVGMLLGALLIGSLAARYGRRHVFIATVSWFSLMMLGASLAHNPALFGMFRFLAGLGLGGVMPVAAASTTEFAPPHRRNVSYVIMQSGYPVGGVFAALLAMWLIPHGGWQLMFAIGGLPLITVVPAALKFLPESRELADTKDSSRRPILEGVRVLFSDRFRLTTITFWAVSFCSLLFVYGLNTWLPSLMMNSGHGATSSLGFLLSFNAGAIVGGVLAGWAADYWNPRNVVVFSFTVGAIAVLIMSLISSEAALFVIASVAGYGAVGTQTLVNGWVTRHYPPEARTTGIGWSLGVGRLGAIIGPTLTGFIFGLTGGGFLAFLTFAIVGIVGAVLAWSVRSQPAS